MAKKAARKKLAKKKSPPKKLDWLVFVDTNIFLDLYRQAGESAGRQLALLEKHQGSLITSEQVMMEFLKNRQRVIIKKMKDLKEPEAISFPPFLLDASPTRMLQKQIKDAKANYGKIKNLVQKVIDNPARYDVVFKTLKRIFGRESSYNLKRPNKLRLEIRKLAEKRFFLGYPPRKEGDNSFCDALNWEWVIRCAQDSKHSHNILIVSRDSDYGLAEGEFTASPVLNDWLRREFKERVGSRRKIELTNRLTTAFKRLDERVRSVDVEEENRLIDKPHLTSYLATLVKELSPKEPQFGLDALYDYLKENNPKE